MTHNISDSNLTPKIIPIKPSEKKAPTEHEIEVHEEEPIDTEHREYKSYWKQSSPSLSSIKERELPSWDQSVKKMLEHTTVLYDLSQISPNSHIHKDRTGRFINTAQGYGFMQSFANWYKAHTPEKLADDLNQFRAQFSRLMQEVLIPYEGIDNTTLLALIQTRIEEALGNEKHGLRALKETYKDNKAVNNAIESLIGELEDRNDTIKKMELTGEFNAKILEEESQQMSPETIGWKKYLCNYTAALYYNHVQCLTGRWNWQDKIGDFENGKLYLGVLPTQSPWQDSLAFMKQESISAVLSITEVFENQSTGYMLSPIAPEQFAKEGIAQTQIPAADFGTLSIDQVERGVEYIHSKLTDGKSVYVHCKAGRGRSALVIMCYLIKYHGKTADEAFALVRSQRKQAGFSQSDPKWQTLQDYEKIYRKGT